MVIIKVRKKSYSVPHFTHIIHISDIHIRPLERHDEFKKVFSDTIKMVEKLHKENPSIIAITGDTFDNKTNFKPETIHLCETFLARLAKITKVFIIAGNHDMVESNVERMDSITPVARGIQNLEYIKFSGHYIIGDHILVVSSLYDKKFIKASDVPNPEKKKLIAMYHGALIGAKTDTGQTIEQDPNNMSTRFRSVKDFDGFDMVLLGDIHLHQTLRKGMAYAGSLIQQNHGEKIEGHGILHWNISDNSTQLYPVKNEYGFADIICRNGKWIKTKLPKHTYGRFLLDDKTTDTQYQDIVKEVEKSVDTLKTTTKRYIKDTNVNLNDIADVLQTNVVSEYELIKEESERVGADLKKILELHNKYKEEAGIGEHNINTNIWRPMHMEFSNLFGYKNSKVNKVDFMSGVHSIKAPNASGKTSLMNILLFGIFGKTPLNPGPRSSTYDVVNNSETHGYVKILFKYCNKLYLIKRLSLRSRNSSSQARGSKLDRLSTYTFTAELWESNLNKEELKKISESGGSTDKVIKDMFGDIDDFLLSNIIDKEISKDILSITQPSERINSLKKIFKIDTYDTYKKLNANQVKKLKEDKISKQSEMNGILSTTTYNCVTDDDEILKNKDELTSLSNQRKEKEVSIKKLEKKLNNINYELKNIEVNDELTNLSTSDIGIQISKIGSVKKTRFSVDWYKAKIEELENQKAILKRKVLVTDKKPKDIQNEIDELSKQVPEDFEYSEDNHQHHIEESAVLKSEVKTLKKQTVKPVEKVKCDIDDNLLDEAKKNNELKMKELNRKLYNLSSDKKCLEVKLHELENNLNNFKYSEIYPKYYQKNKEEIIRLTEEKTHDISNLKSKLELLSKNIFDCETTSFQTVRDAEQFIEEQQRKIIDVGVHLELVELSDSIEQVDQLITSKKSEIVRTITGETDNSFSSIREELKKLPKYKTDSWNSGQSYKKVDTVLVNKVIQALDTNEKELDEDKIATLLKIIEELSELNMKHKNILDSIKHNEIVAQQKHQILENNKYESLIESAKKYINKSLVEELSNEIKAKEDEHLVLSIINDIIPIREELEYHASNNIILNQISEIEDKTTLISKRQDFINWESKIKLISKKNTEIEYHDTQCILHDTSKNISKLHKLLVKVNECKKNSDLLKTCEENITSFKDLLSEQEKYDKVKKLETTKSNILLNLDNINRISELNNELSTIEDQLTIENNLFEKMHHSYSELSKKVTIAEESKKSSLKNKELVEKLKSKIIATEQQMVLHEKYDQIMSNKGLPTKVLFNMIKSIEAYINLICEGFTKYKIDFLLDKAKQNLEIVTVNNTTGKALSFQRLSGYEKAVVRIAMKRALNKFSYNSKSSLMIIDEAFDVIDDENFADKLPKLINLISSDYELSLVISQRDITHISDHVFEISNGKCYLKS